MTRHKAIQMMDCENLAKFLEEFFCQDCSLCPVYDICVADNFRQDCPDYLKEWLEGEFK